MGRILLSTALLVLSSVCLLAQHDLHGSTYVVTGNNPLDSGRQWEIFNLGPQINSMGMEYGGCLSTDGLTIYFTAMTDVQNGYKEGLNHLARHSGGENLDIWMSRRSTSNDSIFGPPRNLGMPVNSGYGEGEPSVSSDGTTLFFTGCNRTDGKGACDIYAFVAGTDHVVNVGVINTKCWETDASLSADGNSLYYCGVACPPRDGEGSKNLDLYVTHRLPDGSWGPSELLPAPINSSSAEASPALVMGDSVLVFASDRPGGFGKFDFYYSQKKPDGSWGEPKNFGEPFNTSDDDRTISVSRDGRTILLGSTRTDLVHGGDMDLFMARPVR